MSVIATTRWRSKRIGLLPRCCFPFRAFAGEVRVPWLDNLLILKQRWGASVAAMMMRCHALGLLDDDEVGTVQTALCPLGFQS